MKDIIDKKINKSTVYDFLQDASRYFAQVAYALSTMETLPKDISEETYQFS